MDTIYLHNISDLFKLFKLQQNAKHPLVGIIDFTKMDEHVIDNVKITADFYTIIFKNYAKDNIKYGRKSLDFQEGSLICLAPNQSLEMDADIEERLDMQGWGLFFHPDLIRATSLGNKMKNYNFFSYEISEALHLSDKEKQVLWDCVQKIETELKENIDSHTQNLIVSNIELLLNYCSRYYGRQFITRKNTNSNTVSQIEKLLNTYFKTDKLIEKGLPTVKYLAENVHLSASYLSDLLKKETGMNAQDHIHYYLIEEAKIILLNTDNSVTEIAYSLGFEYPQYFSKLFKQKTGKTPIAYRNLN